MADRTTERRWLDQLTSIPTVPGHEHGVMGWITAWAGRRSDLRVDVDGHGNLHVLQRGRTRRAPVVAVAHADHPGFVVTRAGGRRVMVEFRGGVRSEYFEGSRVELFDGEGAPQRGRLMTYDPDASSGEVLLDRAAALQPGHIGRWSFGSRRIGLGDRFLLAPACDDLAGVAAALAALDRARRDTSRRHFSVLVTRAEEVGFVGAIAASRDRTLSEEARILSIECSRASADAPVGGGPVVRVGDRSSVFDHDLTNRIAAAASAAGLDHQRRLMVGGSCEATAFVAYGYRATGLCLPLENYHNMGHLDEVERGDGPATPAPELISLADFHGLVDLLGVATEAVDQPWGLVDRLDERFEAQSAILRSGES